MESDRVEVAEVVPGEFEVRLAERTIRVLVPAGVGVPGLDEADLAGGLVAELHGRGETLPDVLDVSSAFVRDPGLAEAVLARVDVDG